MPLCSICDSINLGATAYGFTYADHPETNLGAYPEIVIRAEQGCEGCAFFEKILRSSERWKDKIDELSERVVFFSGTRLDARKKHKLDVWRWIGDDMAFDVCVPEGYRVENVKRDEEEEERRKKEEREEKKKKRKEEKEKKEEQRRKKKEEEKGEREEEDDEDDEDEDEEEEVEEEDDEDREANREELDERRIIPVDPSEAIKQVEAWISECQGHGNCSTPRIVPLPKRIIEIPINPNESPRVCLSEGKTGEYVVLSHCSGDVQYAAITDFPASLDAETLPKTLTHAITITRRLGYQYLWAAPLCVIQDDESDWIAESSKFASTYGKAALMIAASEGVNANSGLLHERHSLYSPALGIKKNRYLRLQYLRSTTDLIFSALNARGWAAIERILAPRILHFTKRQMIWECAEGIRFEASGAVDTKLGSGQVSRAYRKEIVQPYIEKALHDHPIEVEAVGSPKEMLIQVARSLIWLHCLNEFSGTSFRDSDDTLRAMTPIARIIDDGNMGEYLAGVWSKSFAFGLSWGRANKLLTPAPKYRAPSWSWASVDGRTSSSATHWPSTLMQDHAQDPAWLQKYEPKLISHHMVLADPANPYGSVLEGSHLIVSGLCIGLMKLVKSLPDDSGVRLRAILDFSPLFECPCCMKTPAEEREKAGHEFISEIDHHICMVLMGDAWRFGDDDWRKGFCELLILKGCREKDTFVKVGSLHAKGETTTGSTKTSAEVHQVWDGLEWERRELRLI